MIDLFKDKQLVFLEKDYKCPASQDSIDYGIRFLDTWLELPDEQVNAMIVHYQFNQMDRDELAAIIFNPNNIIVTYSVYVQGSDAIFKKLMATTGRNDVKGLTYIDASGALIKYLNRNLRDVEKDLYDIISAINSNNIITINHGDIRGYDAVKPQLLKIDIKGAYQDCVSLIELKEDNFIPIDKNLFNIGKERVRNV